MPLLRWPRPGRHLLESEHLSRARFDAAWEDRLAGRPEEVRVYLNVHRERHYELFNAAAWLLRGREKVAKVLEVGPSEYLGFHKALFPDIELASLDRPLTLCGFDEGTAKRLGADRHYNLDLNQFAPAPDWGEPPMGRFDLVVCTEVIEHLVVNPAEFLESLLGLLERNGRLYLTTPNFLREENLRKIARGENPQPAYPRRGENQDAHHHFHEFTMAELLAAVQDAGGRVEHHYFSACWDTPEVRAGPVERRGNLVVVAARRDAPQA